MQRYDASNPFLTARQRFQGALHAAPKVANTQSRKPFAFGLPVPVEATAFDFASFTLAGHAIVTIENVTSGNHFTYRVTACEDKPGLFFVAVLTGPENTSDYTYLGTIRDGVYAHGRKSTMSEDAPCAVVFGKVWARRHALPACVRVHHEGRCGVCSRTLTTPESLARGVGPECAKNGGLA